jgi:hypothetical protein
MLRVVLCRDLNLDRYVIFLSRLPSLQRGYFLKGKTMQRCLQNGERNPKKESCQQKIKKSMPIEVEEENCFKS